MGMMLTFFRDLNKVIGKIAVDSKNGLESN